MVIEDALLFPAVAPANVADIDRNLILVKGLRALSSAVGRPETRPRAEDGPEVDIAALEIHDTEYTKGLCGPRYCYRCPNGLGSWTPKLPRGGLRAFGTQTLTNNYAAILLE